MPTKSALIWTLAKWSCAQSAFDRAARCLSGATTGLMMQTKVNTLCGARNTPIAILGREDQPFGSDPREPWDLKTKFDWLLTPESAGAT